MDAYRNVPREGNANGRADFDFFIGDWNVVARRLRDGVWEPVTGTTRVLRILQGAGNVDEDEFQLSDQVYVGGMLRLFDAGTNTWSTYGLDRDRGAPQPPMTGGFSNGRGEFHGEEIREGRSVLVRHVYNHGRDDPLTCRWEQALSVDGGKSWETNWMIEFQRAERPSGN
jgi:hypothetical protein